jgi:peptide/nickel transport system permease protein
MMAFLLKRMLMTVFVLLGASLLSFAMVLLAPGDTAQEIALARYGENTLADAEVIAWVRRTEGLDQPLHRQYLRWLGHLARLDMGRSLVDDAPVSRLLATRFANTLKLASAAMALALALALPLGFIAGWRVGSFWDTACSTVAVAGISIPNFWLGLLLILAFSVKLGLLPSYGHATWQHMILPAITLGTAMTAYTARLLRTAVMETLDAEFIMALRARGVWEGRILGLHALKNALVPVITMVGLEFAMILDGAVITETIFAWPGLGDLMVTAVSDRDYPLIQGLVLFTALIFATTNLAVDLLYGLLDPRIRQG